MTYAKQRLVVVMGGLLLASAAACSDALSSDAASGGGGPNENAPSDKGGSNDTNGGSAPSAGAFGSPSASGVVLVHAAAFPSFRLCFENSPDLVPQPDSKVMPEANVVGVEVGSVVRIDPLAAPGKIYVLNERSVRSAAGDTTGVKCGELLGTGTRSLTPDNDYHVASTIAKPLGQGQVQVLAITGCGSQAFLNSIHASETTSATCNIGTTKQWNTTTGNLEARVIDLNTTPQGATASALPVQLVHVAPAIQAQLGTASLDVRFGALDQKGTLPQEVASKPTLLGTSAPITLDVDQSKEAVYGTYGFRIAVRDPAGGTKLSVDQSLAAVQELSSPRDLPSTYFRVASNYALLLLGDPSVPLTLDGGAENTDRRQIHLLAVPVLDPSQIDAGAPATDAAPPDGGAK